MSIVTTELSPPDKDRVISKAFMDGLVDIGRIYYTQFYDNPEQLLKMFLHTQVPLQVMVRVYKMLCKEKIVIPIEELDKPTREKLWQQAKATQVGISKEKAIQLSMAIWCLHSINEYPKSEDKNEQVNG